MDEKSKEFLNKRKFSRISLIDPIRLLTSEYAYEEYMGNISKTGCMILSLKNVEIGQKIKVAINCPDKGYINFDCEVKRSKEKDLEEIEAENKEIKDLLVVDDDQEVNETIVSALDENFGIQSCLNAKTARELLKIYNFRAVLCDARMPGEDGASLLEFIAKEQPECKRLLITGQADNELMQRAVNGGQIDKVFYKPVDMLGLKDILKQYVEQGAAFEAAKSTRQRYYNCYSCNQLQVAFVPNLPWELLRTCQA